MLYRSILSEVMGKFSKIMMSHAADISRKKPHIGYLIPNEVEPINMQS